MTLFVKHVGRDKKERRKLKFLLSSQCYSSGRKIPNRTDTHKKLLGVCYLIAEGEPLRRNENGSKLVGVDALAEICISC